MRPTASFPARLALAAFLLSGSGAMGVVPVGATSDQVTWVRDPVATEPAGRLGLRIPCGGYGVFHFQVDGTSGLWGGGAGLLSVPHQQAIDPVQLCLNLPGCESGQEVPPRYALINVEAVPMSSQNQTPLPGGSGSSLVGPGSGKRKGSSPFDGSRKASAWAPCLDGSCFNSRSVPTTGRPWVAVIDWDDPHGWSVGWTIRELVGQDHDIALFPFLTPALQAFSGKGVTDVHTLAKLCEISDAVDQNLAPPPTVINMSFGRFTRPGLDADRGALCTTNVLSCQIVRLLEHLYRAPTASVKGTVPVAAAGNYRSLQFPASVQTVIPAGGLDLNGFLSQRSVLSTWETAPELTGMARARGLLPASGVCLEANPGVVSSFSWAAPPGTSYSSAILAGMVAVELTASTIADPLLPEVWSLSRTCSSGGVCSYSLQQGSQRAYEPRAAANLLLSRLFDPRGRECGVDPPQGENIADGSVAPALVSDPTLTAKSFLQSLSGWDLPSPDSNPCIPCAGARQPPPKSMRFLGINALTATPVQPTPQVPPAPGQPGSQPVDAEVPVDVDAMPKDWWVDFSESGTFGEGASLDSIFLRTGTEFRRVTVPLAAMDLLRGGKLDGLYLRGAGNFVNVNRQASLIFLVRGNGTAGSETFWTSIPVYFQ